VCDGSSSVLSALGNATAYTWQPGSLSGSPVSVFPANPTIYTVTADLDGCTSSATIAVNTAAYPDPAGTILGPVSVCAGSMAETYNVLSIPDATSYLWSYSGMGAFVQGTGNSATINFASNATSGTLTVTGSNSCGLGSPSLGFPINVIPLPLVSASALPAMICLGQSSELTAAGNAASYTWQPGSLSGSPQTVSPSATTVFTVTGNLLGCTDTSSVVITVDPCTGITENDQSGDIKVGPVPVHDQLVIECNTNTDLMVSLFTVEGKLLSVQRYVGDRTYYFPTADLSASIYFLRIRSDNETRAFKIVKE
jgi:hypothetical protein